MSSADDLYEHQNDTASRDVPAGDSIDNDYASRTGQSEVPVQKDDAPVDDPIDPATADSDATLGMQSPIPGYHTIVFQKSAHIVLFTNGQTDALNS